MRMAYSHRRRFRWTCRPSAATRPTWTRSFCPVLSVHNWHATVKKNHENPVPPTHAVHSLATRPGLVGACTRSCRWSTCRRKISDRCTATASWCTGSVLKLYKRVRSYNHRVPGTTISSVNLRTTVQIGTTGELFTSSWRSRTRIRSVGRSYCSPSRLLKSARCLRSWSTDV